VFTQQLCGLAGAESSTCAEARSIVGLLAPAACEASLKDFALTEQRFQSQRAKCDELATTLCAGVGADTDSCRLVKQKTPSFPPAQCEAMLAQSAVLIEDLKEQELRNQPLSSEVQAKIAAAGAPSFGPSTAKVTIVEFSDFQCPFCSQAAEVTKLLREKYTSNVRFVFRQFPLPFHPNAKAAAESALAAHAQGKFWQFHDTLFANQSKLAKGDLTDYAKQTGLNLTAYKAAVDGGKFTAAVEADVALGESVGVNGTPTLFVNGKRVANATDFAAVSEVVDAALQ